MAKREEKLGKKINCLFCLRPFRPLARIKDAKFCQRSCKRAYEKAGPNLAGKRRAGLIALIDERIDERMPVLGKYRKVLAGVVRELVREILGEMKEGEAK